MSFSSRIHSGGRRAWEATWPVRRPLISRFEYNLKLWVGDVLRIQSSQSRDQQRIADKLASLQSEIRFLTHRFGASSVDRSGHLPADHLIFLHIPKTGGTALTGFISSHFPPEDCVVFPGVHWVTEDSLNRRFISGHIDFDVIDRINGSSITVTVLRNPVSRTLSEYSYYQYVDAPAGALASQIERLATYKKMSIEEYARHGRANMATMLLAGAAGTDSERLARAKARLETFDVVGVHERLWEAAVMLCSRMGWAFPGEIELANVTKNRIREEDVDQAVPEAIRERDHLDCELYAFANELAEQRWKQAVTSMVNRLCD